MDDLISRQALCKYALNQKDKSITSNEIMRFPSANILKGKWIKTIDETSPDRSVIYRCSNCGNVHRKNICKKLI